VEEDPSRAEGAEMEAARFTSELWSREGTSKAKGVEMLSAAICVA
jgi:hypothetical protein